MTLFYRGAKYENESLTLDMIEGEVGGKYRGQEWYEKYPRHIPQTKPKFDLQHRGVAYSVSAMPIKKQELLPLDKTNTINNVCPVHIRRKVVQGNKLAEVHLENIKRNLERRIEIAISKGDTNLIKLLKEEQLALKGIKN